LNSDCLFKQPSIYIKYLNVPIGAFGVDFTHDSGDGLDRVRKGLLQYGVTGFCHTIVTTTSSNYHEVSIVLSYFKIILVLNIVFVECNYC